MDHVSSQSDRACKLVMIALKSAASRSSSSRRVLSAVVLRWSLLMSYSQSAQSCSAQKVHLGRFPSHYAVNQIFNAIFNAIYLERCDLA